MSYHRSYFLKNNTIIKESQVNTAKNANTELFYGSAFSKFLFQVDFSDLQTKITSGDLVINNDTKHYLHLTNTIFGDEALLNTYNSAERQRATSFDLILFKIPEYWDEGVGNDYNLVYEYSTDNKTYDHRPSNWFNRTTLNTWTVNGVYFDSPVVIGTQHFDTGNENLKIDITDYVNGVILSGNTDYGLGLAFSLPYQDITALEADQSVAFFSKYTQTFYEPYVETIFEDVIKDDRQNFIPETLQNLYLYVTKGSNFYDLDSLPTVDIQDSTKTPINGLTGLITTKIRKGVYKVTFGLTGQICDGKRFYYDNWKNLSLDGVSVANVSQKFVPKPYTAQFSIGDNPIESQRYAVQFYGVSLNEKVQAGDVRKITTTFRSIDYPGSVLFDEAYYRIFVKEGHTQVTVFDWTLMDKTNENSFTLDTSILIPRVYWIEIKGKKNGEFIHYKEYINFEIISEKK
jgi:hypothetical protein